MPLVSNDTDEGWEAEDREDDNLCPRYYLALAFGAQESQDGNNFAHE